MSISNHKNINHQEDHTWLRENLQTKQIHDTSERRIRPLFNLTETGLSGWESR